MLPLTGFEPVNRDETVPGGTEGVRLVCLRKVDLAFRVLDPDGHPVEGAEVVVHRGGMTSYSSPTDGKGRAKFTDFVLKRVSEVEVRPPRDREDLLPFRHRKGLPDDRTIRLEPALPLAGIVRDTDGRPVPEGQVSWRRAGTEDPWNWTIADMDGRFRIPRVPVARIQVGAAAPDYENHPEHDQVRTVDAGREDLAFVVRKTPMIVLRFEDWAEGETGTVRHAVDGRDRTGRWGREIGESGIVRLAGLKADDTVSVFVQTSGGRVWVGHGRKPGDRPAVVRGLRESKITGRLIGMPEDPHLAIEAHVFWDLRIRGTIEEDGRFEIVGVPPGTWTIKVRPTHKFGRRWGEAEAPTGGHVEIRLGRRPPGR
jgi:hypothetical protein